MYICASTKIIINKNGPFKILDSLGVEDIHKVPCRVSLTQSHIVSIRDSEN